MHPANFYLGIKALIVRDDSVLVLEKTDENGRKFWDIPGGRMAEGEDIPKTLDRELKEELPGIEYGGHSSLIYVYKLPQVLKDGKGLFLVFYSVKAKLPKVKLSSEHTAFRWVSLSDLSLLGKDGGPYINEGYREAISLVLNK